MDYKNSELKLIKAILKAETTKSELIVLSHLIKQAGTTVLKTNTEMALALKMKQPNFVRAITSLKDKNVVGERTTGLFIRSKKSWGDSDYIKFEKMYKKTKKSLKDCDDVELYNDFVKLLKVSNNFILIWRFNIQENEGKHVENGGVSIKAVLNVVYTASKGDK
jgi:DNA-binding MarR family transcriptional regulator